MGTHSPRLLSTDEFYNEWSMPFYLRMIVDVRSKQVFQQGHHASMAVNYDPEGDESLSIFIARRLAEEYTLIDRIVFYDEKPFHLSKTLKAIHTATDQYNKLHNIHVSFLDGGMECVKSKYEFIWQAKEEETAYPSVILDDFLYLGDEECAIDKEVITNLGITHVLTALPVSQFSSKFESLGVVYCQCPVQDISTDPINLYFDSAIQFIESAKNSKREKKARVLVHCMAGVSRSPTLVIAYLMHSLKKNLKEAYLYVLSRRRIIHPNEGFLRMLLKRDKEIQGHASISLDELENL